MTDQNEQPGPPSKTAPKPWPSTARRLVDDWRKRRHSRRISVAYNEGRSLADAIEEAAQQGACLDCPSCQQVVRRWKARTDPRSEKCVADSDSTGGAQ
jgi:hypothetical protein